MRAFATRLKELRTEKNKTQAELALELKVSQSMIARWESDECEPTATNIITIAEYFNVKTDYLLGKDEY